MCLSHISLSPILILMLSDFTWKIPPISQHYRSTLELELDLAVHLASQSYQSQFGCFDAVILCTPRMLTVSMESQPCCCGDEMYY